MFKIIWAVLELLPSNKITYALRSWLLRKKSGFKIGRNVKIGRNLHLYPNISLSVGDNVTIGNNLTLKNEKIQKTSHLSIGNDTLILSGILFDCTGNLFIGRDCHIGRNTKFYTHLHYHKNNTLSPKNQPIVTKDVTIGDGTALYEEAVIMPGVSIAKNCVVGIRSIVTKNFSEECSVIAGIPARVIGNRFD